MGTSLYGAAQRDLGEWPDGLRHWSHGHTTRHKSRCEQGVIRRKRERSAMRHESAALSGGALDAPESDGAGDWLLDEDGVLRRPWCDLPRCPACAVEATVLAAEVQP